MAKKTMTVGPSASSPVMSKDYADHERKYEAREALRTLTRADEIRRDKPLMREVKREATAIVKTVMKPKAKR